MTTETKQRAMGYRATRSSDGTLTIHDVPIFVTCKRGEKDFDTDWIHAAVDKAKQSEREGYMPPLHIRHHEPETAATNAVRAAGYFHITGTQTITFKGRQRLAVMADLIITDPKVQEEVLAKRLPYRSVEIFDVNEPAIDGLALLDHEAPFLELPMLMVSEVGRDASRGVTHGTFRASWLVDAQLQDSPVVACFRRGDHAYMLFREEPMADKTKTKAKAKPEPKTETRSDDKDTVTVFADDDGEKKDDKKPFEKGEGGGDDKGGDGEEEGGNGYGDEQIAAIVQAIQSGAISVRDQQTIMAALQGQQQQMQPQQQQPMGAPAPVPGQQVMKKETDDVGERFAALKGENDGLKARLDEVEALQRRKDQVAEAMKRLEDRPLGADLETKLVAFHKEHGAKAFATYVDHLAQAVGVLPGDNGKGEAFKGQSANVPEVAMRYQDAGTDAAEKAATFCREWTELRERGLTRQSEERYVEINMARLGVTLKKQTA
jgi:hypothetical protein